MKERTVGATDLLRFKYALFQNARRRKEIRNDEKTPIVEGQGEILSTPHRPGLCSIEVADSLIGAQS